MCCSGTAVIGLVASLLILPSLCQLRWPGIEVLSHLTCTAVTLVTPGRAPWVLRLHATMCSRFRRIHLQAHARAYVHIAHGLACERARRRLLTQREYTAAGPRLEPHCGRWLCTVGGWAHGQHRFVFVLATFAFSSFVRLVSLCCFAMEAAWVTLKTAEAKSRVWPSHRLLGTLVIA